MFLNETTIISQRVDRSDLTIFVECQSDFPQHLISWPTLPRYCHHKNQWKELLPPTPRLDITINAVKSSSLQQKFRREREMQLHSSLTICFQISLLNQPHAFIPTIIETEIYINDFIIGKTNTPLSILIFFKFWEDKLKLWNLTFHNICYS